MTAQIGLEARNIPASSSRAISMSTSTRVKAPPLFLHITAATLAMDIPKPCG